MTVLLTDNSAMEKRPYVFILLRVRPEEKGMGALYDFIASVRFTGPGGWRLIFDDELWGAHADWKRALSFMERMGCVEWTQRRPDLRLLTGAESPSHADPSPDRPSPDKPR